MSTTPIPDSVPPHLMEEKQPSVGNKGEKEAHASTQHTTEGTRIAILSKFNFHLHGAKDDRAVLGTWLEGIETWIFQWISFDGIEKSRSVRNRFRRVRDFTFFDRIVASPLKSHRKNPAGKIPRTALKI